MLETLVAETLTNGIRIVQKTQPAAYDTGKITIGITAELLGRLDTMLADDTVSTEEVARILADAEAAGVAGILKKLLYTVF